MQENLGVDSTINTDLDSALTNIRIVLVNTSHPGNIGAAARVMKNMGLKQLYLVEPKLFPHADATAMAAGANDILEHALIFDTLEDALSDCQLVLGTTARSRKLRHQILEPREAAAQCAELSVDYPLAVVFGRERTGLTNAETDQCEILINIPTSPGFSSLNVASAVQILSYELKLAHRDKDKQKALTQKHKAIELASHNEIENYFLHLQQTIEKIGFLDIKHSPQIMPKLKSLYHRCNLQKSEVNMLRGILTAVGKNRS
jgi:tRNA (cytidine32/uridine32-2'-O)-methyltransferase